MRRSSAKRCAPIRYRFQTTGYPPVRGRSLRFEARSDSCAPKCRFDRAPARDRTPPELRFRPARATAGKGWSANESREQLLSLHIRGALGRDAFARFDGRSDHLLEEFVLRSRELLGENLPQRRRPRMGRCADENIPGGDERGHDIDVQLQVNLAEAGTANHVE